MIVYYLFWPRAQIRFSSQACQVLRLDNCLTEKHLLFIAT